MFRRLRSETLIVLVAIGMMGASLWIYSESSVPGPSVCEMTQVDSDGSG